MTEQGSMGIAQNTGDLGHFVIKKEEASSSGVRRIKAILEK